MKIIVASGGRFHSVHLARQLLQRNVLTRFYSWACTHKDQKEFEKLLKRRMFPIFLIKIYEKFRLTKILSPEQFTILYDNLFDSWLNKELQKEEPFDLLVGWAHYLLKSIPTAKKKGAKIALECGSMHILDIQHVLNTELELHGFLPLGIDQRNVDKILQEYQEADAIMVPSTHVAESFKKYQIPETKIHVVPYGAEPTFFISKQKKPEQFSALFVGRVGLAKGIHYLLEAWKILNLPASKTRLDIVGPIDEQTKKYLTQRKSISSIIWHGGKPQNDLTSFYQNSSVFVMPSLQEGLAMVLIEAMAAELPLIATTRTGAEDLIVNGKEGFLVPPNNIQLLAERIEWAFLHQNELYEMGKQAAKKAAFYTWNQYGDTLIKSYQAICYPHLVDHKKKECQL